jgi:hypothetical protein
LIELLSIHEEKLAYSSKGIGKILSQEGAFSVHRISLQNEFGLRLLK